MTITQIRTFIQRSNFSEHELEMLISMYLGERFIDRTNNEGIIENFDVVEAVELAKAFIAMGQLMNKK